MTEKVHRIDTHIVAASAGVNADAEILVNTARFELFYYCGAILTYRLGYFHSNTNISTGSQFP